MQIQVNKVVDTHLKNTNFESMSSIEKNYLPAAIDNSLSENDN
jgi:hypothetical protein